MSLRRLARSLGLVIFMVASSASSAQPDPRAGTRPAPAAVVELFTSEGCSSCPTADRFARQLSAEAREESARIFVLAYHVDYWNELGWTDRFSQAQFTQRQREYARRLGIDRIFTPQMIVNGEMSFVGSNRTVAHAQVRRALEAPLSVRIDLSLERVTQGRELLVGVRLEGAPAGARLQLAVVQRGLSSQVEAGENKGQLLLHPDVVRRFLSVEPRDGQLAIPLPDGLSLVEASLVAFVQADDLRLLGATAVDLGQLLP